MIADRRLHWAVGGSVGLALLLLVILAAFPWGSFKSTLENRLSARFGRPVTIGRVERLDSITFHPLIAIEDLRVPQPGWAGTGNLARISVARMRFSAWSLLTGHFSPEAIEVRGARLTLIRDAQGRENWRQFRSDRGGNGGAAALQGLKITDALIIYRDAKQDRSFAVHAIADPANGVRLTGSGLVWGQPVQIRAHGPAIEQAGGKPWPFRATIKGPALGIDARGTMDAPLDTGRMTFDATAHALDLKLIDAVIEAGLFGTQPLSLSLHARRDGPGWTLTSIKGMVGRSDIAGQVTVKKRDGRTKLDGKIVSDTLDFDDLASNAGLARAMALRRETGPKLVPNLRINIRKIRKTDGTISFAATHLVGRNPSSLTAIKGTARIDHQLLTIAPLTITLRRGTISGSMRVDQRGGRPLPLVSIDLALRDSSVDALAGGAGAVEGRVDARARLTGTGSTIREVVGRSDGTIGLVARDGSLPAKVAALIGFDVGREFFTGKDDRAGLRCVVLRLVVRSGTGRVDPLVIDTTRSQSTGAGAISFPDETVAIHLTGAPKGGSLLRLPGSAELTGTIRDPHVAVPREVKSIGNVFKAIGRAITGDQGPTATDADCAALAARALG